MEYSITKVYCVRKLHRMVGVVCTIFFSLLGLLTVLAPTLDRWAGRNPGNVNALYFVALVWLVFILLGLYFTLACRRFRLTITGRLIEIQNLIRHQQFDIDDIGEMIWLTTSSGVKFKGPFGKAKVEFVLFLPAEQYELTRLLFGLVPLEKQRNWEEFGEEFIEEQGEERNVS